MAIFIQNSRGSTSPAIDNFADILGEASRMYKLVELPYS